MSKHTPGPWFVAGHLIVTGGGDVVCSLSRNAGDDRLIAAAPDLLDALELARGWVATRLGDTHEDLQKIDAAIKKAKGE